MDKLEKAVIEHTDRVSLGLAEVKEDFDFIKSYCTRFLIFQVLQMILLLMIYGVVFLVLCL